MEIEKILLIIAIIVFVILPILIFGIIAYSTDEWVDVHVKEKERVAESDGGRYLIFTDEEVFKNTDSIWYWKFNSSDFYGQIEEDQNYKFKVYGYRIPFLSWYRNIIEIKQ